MKSSEQSRAEGMMVGGGREVLAMLLLLRLNINHMFSLHHNSLRTGKDLGIHFMTRLHQTKL